MAGRMTAVAQGFRRDVPVATGRPPALPRTGVRGEIKPHNTAGIRAGLEQLRRPGRAGTPVLLTYRTISDDAPTAFEVLMAAPEQVEQAVRGARPAAALDRWFRIGTFTAPQAVKQIPLAACPTRFGVTVEPQVRAAYVRFMRQTHPGFGLGRKHPSAPGHDVLHEELAEFLHELAARLDDVG